MQGLDYHVDIGFMLDGTESMNPFMAQAKERILLFYNEIKKRFEQDRQILPNIRVKVLVYRDFYHDGTAPHRHAAPFTESPFFFMPDDKDELEKFVNGIRAEGGGDAPESGLEALALAMRCEWTHEGDRQRHVIVVLTDAPAHPLPGDDEARKQEELPSAYPTGLPQTFAELTELWGSQVMAGPSKRLLLFAPKEYPWPDIKDEWDNVLHHPSAAGQGLKELAPEEMINLILYTMGT